jgi:hypothetical protein
MQAFGQHFPKIPIKLPYNIPFSGKFPLPSRKKAAKVGQTSAADNLIIF